MEKGRVPPNHLVNRLYKNFSQSKLSQKSLIAKDMSSIHGNSSFRERNILVPLFQSSQRQSSFRKSMISEDKKTQDISMISRNESSINLHKNRFSKMILEDSKFLSDEVSQNEQNINKLKNKFKENKGRIFKKKAIIRSSNKGDQFGLEEKDLTLIDFINLLKQEPDVSDQFVYLKIVSHPYDLKIVDYDHGIAEPANQKTSFFNKKAPLPSIPHDQHDRITISARGITYLNEDQPVFVPLDEWQKQAQLYSKLTKLSFFKQYRVWKNFCVWKKYIRRINMKKVSEILSRQLLFADKQIRPSLLYSKSLLLRLQNIKLCKIDESQKQIPTYSEFKQQQNKFRTEDLPHNINYIQQQILINVLNTCKLSLKSFKQQNRIGSIQTSIGNKAEPLLIGDNSNKPMPYTEEATVKTHYEKLTKFMKLIDSLIIDGKLKLIFESTSSLRQIICSQNDEYYTDVIATNEKLMYKGHQWFFCEIFFEQNSLVFDPNLPKTQSVFEQLINKGITHICKKHKSIKTADALAPFISVEQQKLDVVEDVFNLEEIVRTSQVFILEYAGIVKQIERSFSFVQNYSKRLLPFLEIYQNNSEQDLDSYRQKDPEIIQKYIQKWKNEDIQLNKIVEEHESSMLMIQTQKLKQKVKGCASVCLEHIYRLLPEMLKSKFLDLRSKLKQNKQLVENKPNNVEQFIALNENVNRVNGELDELSFSLAEVSFIYNIIKNNKSAMGQSMETLKSKENKLNQLNQLMVSLRGKIDQATMKMNTLKVQFLEQINKISPEINAAVEENYLQVSSYQYSASVINIVDFLQQKKVGLNDIFELNKKLNYYQKNLETEQTSSDILIKYSEYFNKIYKIWAYKQRMDEFSKSIKMNKLNTLDIKSEWSKFQSLLIDIQNLSKACLVEEEQQCHYGLNTGDKAVIFQLQEEILSYTPIMKSIKAMKSQILKQKEWDEIKSHFQANDIDSEVVNKIRNSECTLENIMSQNISKHSKFLTQVTIKANHQAQLVLILQRVSQFWTTNYISCSLYLDYKDVYMLEPNAELWSKIDENLVELNIVKSSKYVDTVMVEAEKQTKLFSNLQQVLQEWKQHEANWLTLQPLLNNTYFKGFPKEMKAFTAADNAWRKIVKVSREHPVKRWAEHQSILQTLKNNEAVYSNIKKLIPEFLRKKRESFPRFYMSSDEQLITMISQCKDFRSTEPHLWRVFPAIQKFDYSSGDKQSQPTGLVNFDNQIIPLKTIRVGIEAQEIFKMLEDSMKQSIKSLIKSSLSAIQKQSFKRKHWIRENPFQVVHLVDMLQWTRMVENDYLGHDASEDLSSLYYAQHLQLNETIQLLNDPNRKISLKVLNSLLVQGIEYRDIAQKLIVENVESVNDFNWAIQIKAYYQNETFVIKQLGDQIPYGYEFIRIFNKLPISPGTEKHRLGLFQLINSSQNMVLYDTPNAYEDLANIAGKNLIKVGSQIAKQSLQSLILGSYLSSSWLLFVNASPDPQRISEITTMIDMVRVSNIHRQNSERFKESAFSIHVQKAKQIPHSIKDNLRNISFVQPDEWFILELQLYKQGLIWSRQFLKQLKPLILKVQGVLQTALSIPKLIESYEKLSINLQWQNDQVVLYILNVTRNHIVSEYKADQAALTSIFNTYLGSKNISLPNYFKPSSAAEISLKSTDVFYMKNNEQSQEWILNQYLSENPKDIKKQNILFVHLKTNSRNELFGYELSNGTWMSGSLQSFMTQNEMKKWLIIEDPSDQVKSILNIAIEQSVLCFSNLSKHIIKQGQLKIFYLTVKSQDKIIQVKQLSLETKVESFVEKNKSKITTYFSDLFKEYFVKTIQTLKRLFKDSIQLPNHKTILDQLFRIVRCFLNSLTNKDTDINDRGLEKLFSWGLFLAISNRVNLQPNVFDKFCKVYQDCIKFQHIKVADLSEHLLCFNAPQGAFKHIQSQTQCSIPALSPKIDLMKMFIQSDESLILLGSEGSFKSTSVNEIIESSSKDHKFIHYFASSTMKLISFINFVINQLDIRKCHQELILEPKGFNNSKLSIFVDNANLNEQIFQFIQWFSKPQYKKLWVSTQNKYIKVSQKLTISGIVSGRLALQSLRIHNLLPVNFNIETEDALLEHCRQQLKDKIQINLLDSLIECTKQTINMIKNMNPNRKYTSHHLSRLLTLISNSRTTTKLDWVKKMEFVYCSELKQSKKDIIDSIWKCFNLKEEGENQSRFQHSETYISTIRIAYKSWEFRNRYIQLSEHNSKLIRYQNKRQIQKLAESESNHYVYFVLAKQNYLEQFQVINQLCHNSPQFVLQVDLQSEQLLNELYIKYPSTIDKCFVIVYDNGSQTSQHVLEKSFDFFKDKVRLNKNNFKLAKNYYQQIADKNKRMNENKINEIQKIIANYTSFKLQQSKVLKQSQQKSAEVKERYFKQECLFGQIKQLNVKLANLRQQIQQKSQRSNEPSEKQLESEAQNPAKQQTVQLERRVAFLTKELNSKEEQVQLNTKTKDILKSQINMLNETIQDFSQISKDLQHTIKKMKEDLIDNHYILQSKVESQSLKEAIQIAYLSKHPQHKRKYFLKKFDAQYQISSSNKIIENFVSLTRQVCCIYDPNRSAAKIVTKLYSQKVVVVTNIQKVPQNCQNKYIMMYIREPERLLSYFIEGLKLSRPQKIILILDYVSQKYPCLNFQTSFDLTSFLDIVLTVFDKYLKDTISGSTDKISNFNKNMMSKQEEIFKIMATGVNSQKLDYLKTLIGKLNQFNNFKELLKDQESQLSRHIVLKQKYNQLCGQLLKFEKLVNAYLPKINSSYEFRSLQFSSIITSALVKVQKQQAVQDGEYIQKVMGKMLQTLFCSIRKQHVLLVQFVWCLIKMQIPSDAIDMLCAQYPKQKCNLQKLLSEFDKICETVEPSTLQSLKNILQLKIKRHYSLKQAISIFISPSKEVIQELSIPDSSIYLVERSSSQTIVHQFFKDSNYQIILMSTGLQKIDECFTAMNPVNLLVVCPSQPSKLENLFFKIIQISKQTQKQCKIVLLVEKYENVYPSMLLYCSKLSYDFNSSQSEKLKGTYDISTLVNEDKFHSMNHSKRIISLSLVILFRILQNYHLDYRVQEINQAQKYIDNLFNTMEELDSSNKWVIVNLLNHMSHKKQDRQLLRVIFFKTYQQLSTILGNQIKQANTSIILSKITEYFNKMTIASFPFSEACQKKVEIFMEDSILNQLSYKQQLQFNKAQKPKLIIPLKLHSLIEIQDQSNFSTALEELVYKEIKQFNKYLNHLNNHVSAFNTFILNKQTPNKYYQSILFSLQKNHIPQQWLKSQSQKRFDLTTYFNYIKGKTDYLTSIKQNDFKIKHVSINYFNKPKTILKKLIEAQQKKIKSQYKVMYGKIIYSQHPYQQISNTQTGILLSNLVLKYCKYDSTKSSLENSVDKTNGYVSILIGWGQLAANLAYEKIPIYNKDSNDKTDIITEISIPFKSKSQLHFTDLPALLAQSLE